MYIKYADCRGELNAGDMVLMSHDEFVSGGKDLYGVPVCITPDGSEPKDAPEEITE
jgi:hypothetical protein